MAMGRTLGDRILNFAIGLSIFSIVFWVGWIFGFTQPKPDNTIYLSPTPISDRYITTEPIDIQVSRDAIDKGWLKVE